MKKLRYAKVIIEIQKYIILPFLILFQNCTQNENIIRNKTRKIDTITIKNINYDSIYKPHEVIKVIHDTIYITDKNEVSFGLDDIGNIMMQEYYDSIIFSHYMKNINVDTICVSKNTIVIINDTIQENKILNRQYHIKERIR